LKSGTTQIFIETPYRNDQMVKDVLQCCKPSIRFCIATDITATSEWIVTKTIKEWKNISIPSIHKRPAIFLIG
jgi:16S rRNA (cytidine1402-2'-O)-methyltransferase